MMSAVRLLPLLVATLALLPATAAAQTPQPDERAAAQALADAAKHLIDAADALEDEPGWTSDCSALERPVPARREADAGAYVESLEQRSFLDRLRPSVQRFRTEIANAHPADPVLLSGRAAARRIVRLVAAFPAGEPDPCAAYEAYRRAGYPPGPAREARALERRLSELVTRGIRRKITAAARRMLDLGVPGADARAFRQLAY